MLFGYKLQYICTVFPHMFKNVYVYVFKNVYGNRNRNTTLKTCFFCILDFVFCILEHFPRCYLCVLVVKLGSVTLLDVIWI